MADNYTGKVADLNLLELYRKALESGQTLTKSLLNAVSIAKYRLANDGKMPDDLPHLQTYEGKETDEELVASLKELITSGGIPTRELLMAVSEAKHRLAHNGRNLQPDETSLKIDPMDIKYPSTPFFPRNPYIADFINPKEITETFTEGDDESLKFENAPDGKMSVIRLKSSPFIDTSKYNSDTNKWVDDYRPIDLTLIGYDYVPTDKTKYTKRSMSSFSKIANNLVELEYYYDGKTVITNYDFANPSDREKVSVKYYKLTDVLKVKAVLVSNSPSIAYSTPTVDQYTLVVGKQKMMR
jgi:hypothetical protein